MGTMDAALGEGERTADAMGKAPVRVGGTRPDGTAQLRVRVRLPGRQHISPVEEALCLEQYLV